MEIGILIILVVGIFVSWFFRTELGYKVYDYILYLMDIDEDDYE